MLPFTRSLVDRVEELAENDQEDITFTDGNGNVIDYEEENNECESEE